MNDMPDLPPLAKPMPPRPADAHAKITERTNDLLRQVDCLDMAVAKLETKLAFLVVPKVPQMPMPPAAAPDLSQYSELSRELIRAEDHVASLTATVEALTKRIDL